MEPLTLYFVYPDSLDHPLHSPRNMSTLYGLYGDYGKLNSYRLGGMSRKILERILRRPVPGWYDTHAKLGPQRA